MYKNRRNQGFNPFGDRKIFKNTPQEKIFNPIKRYYSSIFYDGSSKLVIYECGQRSEAVSYFDEIARLNRGQVEVIGVFK